jgi:hypothetical protein
MAEAFRKGGAGPLRRFITFVDAWFILTPIKSAEFWCVVIVSFVVLNTLRTGIHLMICGAGNRMKASLTWMAAVGPD